jgi:acetyl-CoA synthetase
VTGDRARVRADGELELLGRSDRVFSVAGQLVSADAIAVALADHPFVARALVVDRADSTTGRAVVAVVQPRERPGDEALARELQEHVRELLGGLSQPRSVVFLDRFPEDEDPRLLPALRRLASSAHVVAHLHVGQVTAAMASVASPELDP